MDVVLPVFTIVRKLCSDLGLDSSDISYLCRRLASEGMSFLTSTLPRLWKCVSWSFSVGYFDRANSQFSLTSFAWKRRSLRYFRSLLDKIFDPATGRVLCDASATAVFKLRMLCEYLYKLCLPFTQEALDLAQGSYEAFERKYPSNRTDWQAVHHLEEMRWAIARFFPSLTRASADDILRECHPRYGPGSMNNRVRTVPYWKYKLLPLSETGLAPKCYGAIRGFFKPYPGYRLRPHDQRKKAHTSKECEILFVPKNADGPRVISREDPFVIRLSMSYFDWASHEFERVTNGHVQFRDQTVNRALARIGSIDGSYACADMKEASDRVSYRNAARVFQNCPGILWFIHNARSKVAILPSGTKIPLRKLSGMGSGLTFPTMSLYIYVAAIVGIIRNMYAGVDHIKNVPNVGELWRSISSAIHVFGDDFIVKTQYANHAYWGLELSGMKINVKKSHCSGPFRESCGGDYLSGVDVTPVRLKLMSAELEASNGQDGRSPVIRLKGHTDTYLLERHCRELVLKDMYELADYYYSVIERRWRVKLPQVSGSSPYLGRYVVGGIPPTTARKALIPIPRKETFEHMDPYAFLGRSLRTKKSLFYTGDPVSLYGEVAVPHRVKLKTQLVTMTDLNGTEHAAIDLRSSKVWSSDLTSKRLIANVRTIASPGLPSELTWVLSFALS